MKKLLISFLVVLSLTACGESEKNTTAENTKPVVKIGIVGPMSGNNAALGINCRQAVNLALEELPKKDIEYQLIIEDDMFQPARTANVTHKLINVDKVDAIVACSAVSGAVAAPIASTAKKFIITTIASEASIAKQSKYSFLHWTSPRVEGLKTLEILKNNKAEKIVVFVENHPGARALANGVLEVAQEAGIKTEEITFMSTERNFTDIVLQAQRHDADMWVLETLQPGINLIGKRMQELGIKTPFTSSEMPTFMEDKSMFEGVKFVDVYDGDSQMLERYKTKYQTDNTYAVAFAYDTMVILDKLFSEHWNKNKSIANSEELAQSLANMKEHHGVVGKVVIDQDGILQSEATIKTVQDGKIIVVKE